MKIDYKKILNNVVKLAALATGSGAVVYGNDIFSYIAAASMLASVVASSVKDSNFSKIMTILNYVAVNVDKSQNDKKVNSAKN